MPTEALVIHAGSPLVAGAGPAAQCAGERATHHDEPAQPGAVGEPGILPARARLGAGDGPRLDREPGRPRPARGPSQPVEPRRVRTRAAGRVSVEIDDVEASVRRFIACDPDGKVVDVLSHR